MHQHVDDSPSETDRPSTNSSHIPPDEILRLAVVFDPCSEPSCEWCGQIFCECEVPA